MQSQLRRLFPRARVQSRFLVACALDWFELWQTEPPGPRQQARPALFLSLGALRGAALNNSYSWAGTGKRLPDRLLPWLLFRQMLEGPARTAGGRFARITI